ncbi:MAG: hypothetical protein QF362_04815 [Candidatus Woesearchaeota archaeon]|jgi:hypothetical protein|nr:hypothetical protein [Candidatus Woesearchaeota archaeon]MDP7506733.1 hypothetical protein [Candidatus Woesearchaeota archaeon]MDP7610488.1 hypothetical protein [Candidatus Woesearchaeota archaeon]
MKKKSRHISKKSIIVLITIVIVISFFLVRPRLTGFVSIKKEYALIDKVSITANESSEYTWIPKEQGTLKSFKLSGTVLRQGAAKVYLNYSNKLYLVFDSEQLEKSLSAVTGMVITNISIANQTIEEIVINQSNNETQVLNETIEDQINESTEELVNETIEEPTTNEPELTKTIQLALTYYTESSYDTDNNGFEELDGVIDLTVKDTDFNFNASPDNLCTKWTINSIDKNTISNVCHGSSSCCNFLDMDPSSTNWNDPYYSYFEKDNAGYNNLVSAQIIHAYYDFTTLEADIIYSSSSSLSAKFKAPYIEFEDVCLETCLLPGINETNYNLIFEINNTQLDIDSISYTIEKIIISDHPPKLIKNISDITIAKDNNYIINLSEYFFDEDGDILSYSFYKTDNVSTIINENIAVISPDKGFTGLKSSFFIANDTNSVAVSNVFRINVSEFGQENVSEGLVQGQAVIGKPVKWIRKIKLKESSKNISINITKHAHNITIKKIVNGTKLKLKKEKIKVNNLDFKDYEKLIDGKVKGISIIEELNATTIDILDNSTEYEIEYETEGPSLTEEELSFYKKTITISSDIHYTNILSYTSLPIEVPVNSIKLYWINNGTRERVSTNKFDKNNNSLIDYIEWIVPHLSNQTYELELVILNTQSYPTRGGNWTVMFNANGIGNLTISSSNSTSYSEMFNDNSSTINDLDLLDLRCGDNLFFNKESLFMQNNTYLILSNSTKVKITELANSSLEVSSLFIEDYSCNKTGYHTVRVLTDGKHHQLFDFNGFQAYAHNLVNNIPITSITVFSDMNSTRTKVFLS